MRQGSEENLYRYALNDKKEEKNLTERNQTITVYVYSNEWFSVELISTKSYRQGCDLI